MLYHLIQEAQLEDLRPPLVFPRQGGKFTFLIIFVHFILIWDAFVRDSSKRETSPFKRSVFEENNKLSADTKSSIEDNSLKMGGAVNINILNDDYVSGKFDSLLLNLQNVGHAKYSSKVKELADM